MKQLNSLTGITFTALVLLRIYIIIYSKTPDFKKISYTSEIIGLKNEDDKKKSHFDSKSNIICINLN